MRRGRCAVGVLLAMAFCGVLAACGSRYSAEDAATPDGGVAPEAGASEGSTSDGPAVDAADAAPVIFAPCASRTTDALLCADFDDSPTPLVYVRGIGSAIPGAVNREAKGFGRTAPNALWYDGLVFDITKLNVTGTTSVSHARAELDVYIDTYSPVSKPVSAVLARLGVSSAPTAPLCYVDVRLTQDRLDLQATCSDADGGVLFASQAILTNQLGTGKWWHLVLDVDFATSTASASLDGKVPTALIFASSTKAGVPFVEIGNVAGAKIAFDDILVTAP